MRGKTLPDNHEPEIEPIETSGDTAPETDGDHQGESVHTVVSAEFPGETDVTGLVAA
ncbi:hypothetical protein [Streptomyces katsurahamanus]|uniref:hypothetical protein n=1 Tax=Streptomyces katsurahamanus TaxID=2577098 RepID=UPI0012959324|nr:hypothetical protein [Streptomyces katsurahamanus]